MASALCLGCGARVDDDAPCGCVSLGQGPYRDVPPGTVDLGRCPRCGPPLEQVEYGDTPLDECTACQGVFVDRWILDRLGAAPSVAAGDASAPSVAVGDASAQQARTALGVALPVRPRHRETAVRYLRCPRCSTQMNRTVFGRSSGVVVDVCKSDGIWFDAGELSAVLAFIEGGGLERARQRELAERADAERQQILRRELEKTPFAGFHEPVGRPGDLAADFVAAIVELWRGAGNE
jgi:Zn-finger nucleic acid-binding protein